jgi:hypothetical protein
MISHLQKTLLAAAVAEAMSASGRYSIFKSKVEHRRVQAPPRIIHTVFPSLHTKIKQNIFTLWSSS